MLALVTETSLAPSALGSHACSVETSCPPATKAPDFAHQIDGRRHALLNLFLLGIALVIGLSVAFLFYPIAGAWGRLGLWVLIGGNVIQGVAFVPAAIAGGCYRVVVTEDWLIVDSPHWIFGKSFAAELNDIARLATWVSDEGPDRHYVVLRNGKAFRIDAILSTRRHVPADELFATLCALRPGIETIRKNKG
jgi:hypothetical protein